MALDFSWSLSRHDTFMTCRRRYYYAYYAAQDDPEVARLKRLSALPLWAGSVVHETIEEQLKSEDPIPGPDQQEAIVRAAVHGRMKSDFESSAAGESGFRLFEHEYGVPIEQEDKKIAVGTVQRCLRHFFRSSTLEAAVAAGREQFLSLEDLVSYHVGDVPVFLRMDLAFRDAEGTVVIVDWKSGRAEGRFNDVQLAGYALYASGVGWVEEPEQLVTELVYLVIPRHVRRRVDGRKLDSARGFIRKSAANMKALLLDPVTNKARLEDFPMIDRPRICRRCNFRRLCFPREP